VGCDFTVFPQSSTFCPANGAIGCPLPPVVTVFGVAHTALGQATLVDTGGRLAVSNIGSSGQDGVSSDTSFIVDSFFDIVYTIDFGPPTPPGGSFVVDSFFDIVYRISTTGPGVKEISADASACGSPALDLRIEFFHFGIPVGGGLVPSPAPGEPLVILNLGSSGEDGVSISIGDAAGQFSVDSFFDITYQIDFQAQIPGQPPVLCNQIRLSHEKCVDNPDRSIRLTGQNLSGGMFEIADMQVHQNGSPE
jgi:hypothetical protein